MSSLWFLRILLLGAEKLCRSVERMITYTELLPEAPTRIPETAPEQPWPSDGIIEFKYVVLVIQC